MNIQTPCGNTLSWTTVYRESMAIRVCRYPAAIQGTREMKQTGSIIKSCWRTDSFYWRPFGLFASYFYTPGIPPYGRQVNNRYSLKFIYDFTAGKPECTFKNFTHSSFVFGWWLSSQFLERTGLLLDCYYTLGIMNSGFHLQAVTDDTGIPATSLFFSFSV